VLSTLTRPLPAASSSLGTPNGVRTRLNPDAIGVTPCISTNLVAISTHDLTLINFFLNLGPSSSFCNKIGYSVNFCILI